MPENIATVLLLDIGRAAAASRPLVFGLVAEFEVLELVLLGASLDSLGDVLLDVLVVLTEVVEADGDVAVVHLAAELASEAALALLGLADAADLAPLLNALRVVALDALGGLETGLLPQLASLQHQVPDKLTIYISAIKCLQFLIADEVKQAAVDVHAELVLEEDVRLQARVQGPRHDCLVDLPVLLESAVKHA